MKVFVDASAFVALYHSVETNHPRAVELSKKLLANPERLLTSYSAVLEAATTVRKKVGIEKAIDLLNLIDQEKITIIEDSYTIRLRAQQIFSQSKIRDLSLFDCLDFALMEFYELEAAFTFDKHYKQMGLKTL